MTHWRPVYAKEPYLLRVGRMTTETGPHRAIVAARQAVIWLPGGALQPGQEAFFEREVAPHIDGSARRVRRPSA